MTRLTWCLVALKDRMKTQVPSDGRGPLVAEGQVLENGWIGKERPEIVVSGGNAGGERRRKWAVDGGANAPRTKRWLGAAKGSVDMETVYTWKRSALGRAGDSGS